MRRFLVLAAFGLTFALGLLVGAANAPAADAGLPIEVSTVLQADITPDVPPGTRWEGLHGVLYTSCVGPSGRAPFALPEEFGLGTTRLTADMTRLYTPRGGRLLEVAFKDKNGNEFRRIGGTYFLCSPKFAEMAIAVFEPTSTNKTAADTLKFASKEEAKKFVERVAVSEKEELSSLNGKLYAVDGETWRIIVLRVSFQ